MNSLLAALGLVFVAELGDKTQLVALGFGARHRVAPVLIGVVAGYMATNLLSVVVGGVLGTSLPTRAIGLAGGALLLGFAAWLAWPRGGPADVSSVERSAPGVGSRNDAGADPRDARSRDELAGARSPDARSDGARPDGARPDGGDTVVAVPSRSTSVVMSVAAAMIVAELGDKTMIATATLAAQGRPVLVWLGATMGIVLAGTVSVLVGRVCGARLPERTTRVGSAVLFAVSGIALLAANA